MAYDRALETELASLRAADLRLQHRYNGLAERMGDLERRYEREMREIKAEQDAIREEQRIVREMFNGFSDRMAKELSDHN